MRITSERERDVIQTARGVIQMGGGAIEIHPHETVVVNDQWVTVYHHDKYETRTDIPLTAIEFMRTHDADKEKLGPNVAHADIAG